MNRAEILLAKRWTKAGKSPNAIAILLDRCRKTVRKNLAPKGAAATRVGPTRFLPPRLEQHTDPNGRPLILVRKNV